MKCCVVCGVEIGTRDGDNTCLSCATPQDADLELTLAQRKMRESALRDCGLVKVRGAMGGVYWE